MLAKPKTEFQKRTFGYSGATLWNNLPQELNPLVHLKGKYSKYDSCFVAGFRSQFLMPSFLLCLFAYYSFSVYIFVYFL